MTPCHLPYVGRRRGVFASEDARFGMLVQLRVHATRGRRLEDAWFGTAVRAGFRSRGGGNRRGRASAASRSRYAGECPLCGAPTTLDTGALRTEPPLRVIASAASWSRYAGFFVHEDARVGILAQLRVHATRGSAPSAALGRLEDGAPASRDRLRCRERPSLWRPNND